MKVKIGTKIFDAEKEPIMIMFSKGEKKLITNMDTKAYNFCMYPDTYDEKEIKKFMKLRG